MNNAANPAFCPEHSLTTVIAQLRDDEEAGLAVLVRLLEEWPLDARLHFLQGSVLAGRQRYDESRRSMVRALAIAPDFALARFQLGFLELTSGRALDAVHVWQPLGALPEDAALRIFAEGLANLAADNFVEAARLLRRGMTLNFEHPLINADMQLILDEIRDQAEAAETDQSNSSRVSDPEEAPLSAVDLLLRQQAPRRHSTPGSR